MAHRMANRALRPGHTLQLLKGGERFFPALVEAIAAARAEVLLETYIFDFTRSLVVDVHETMTRLWLRLQITREARQYDVSRALQAVRAAARAGTDMADESMKSEVDNASDADGGALAALVLRDNVRFRRSIE